MPRPTDTPSASPRCSICGEPMPPGEEMFKMHGYSGHGYSGDCPRPPLKYPQAGERRKGERRAALAASGRGIAGKRKRDALRVIYNNFDNGVDRDIIELCDAVDALTARLAASEAARERDAFNFDHEIERHRDTENWLRAQREMAEHRLSDVKAYLTVVEAENVALRGALDDIAKITRSDEMPPLYAYGDNEAACWMSARLEEVAALAHPAPDAGGTK